jgi:hypothetical protein
VYEKVFAAGCSMNNCNARCCREGVFLDPAEREKILQHAHLIKKYLEPHQPADERVWFDEEREVDSDFPSGLAFGTRTLESGCVFLDSKGWCTLQRAAVAEGLHKWSLKPFFCVAYPMTLQEGVLTVDDPQFTERTECCSRVASGDSSPVEACAEEIEFMVGAKGFAELKSLGSFVQ